MSRLFSRPPIALGISALVWTRQVSAASVCSAANNKAKPAYELKLWDGADPDFPALQQANVVKQGSSSRFFGAVLDTLKKNGARFALQSLSANRMVAVHPFVGE